MREDLLKQEVAKADVDAIVQKVEEGHFQVRSRTNLIQDLPFLIGDLLFLGLWRKFLTEISSSSD